MKCYHRYNGWIFCLSFFFATILQIMPLPLQLHLFRPFWLNLLFIYWVVELPRQINIGTGFILGLITDLILGSTLGVHAITLSLIAYLVVLKFQCLRNITFFQQALIITLLSLIAQLMIFLTEYWLINVRFRREIFCSSVVDGFLWPFLSLLMRRIYK